MRLRCISRILVILTAAGLTGCKEDQTLLSFFKDMTNIVDVELPDSDGRDDDCLIANGRAAAQWYAGLSEKHRQHLKENIQRYVQTVRFTKTEIIHDKPESMAGTSVNYNNGVLVVDTRGVLTDDNQVVCAPDIGVLMDFAVDQSFSIAGRDADVATNRLR